LEANTQQTSKELLELQKLLATVQL